jgi:hypothetical protein
MSENFDEIFNEKKLNMAVKKGKIKSTIRTTIIATIISVIVLVIGIAVGNHYNTKIVLKMSEESFKREEELVKFTVPNGYISMSVDNIGFLGGKGTYKISKNIGNKPVVVAERVSVFGVSSNNPLVRLLGFYPKYPITRAQGGAGHVAGEWPTSYWENGYRKMKFYHPDINYTEYRNDLKELDNLSDNQLIEMAVSFDKPYKEADMTTVMGYTKRSWYWIDTFTKEDMDRYKKEAAEYDSKVASINEHEVLGVPVFSRGVIDNFAQRYEPFLIDLLKNTKWQKYNQVYKELEAKGYLSYAEVPILGAVVYGTKSELKQLLSNPHIKASSFGVVTSLY